MLGRQKSDKATLSFDNACMAVADVARSNDVENRHNVHLPTGKEITGGNMRRSARTVIVVRCQEGGEIFGSGEAIFGCGFTDNARSCHIDLQSMIRQCTHFMVYVDMATQSASTVT